MPVGYGEILNWLVTALGAALLLGTGAALLTYRRTGTFPGTPPGRPAQPTPRRASVGTAVAKCVAGAVLVVVGLSRLVAGGAL